MKIVCIAADASSNSLVRVYPIVKVLQRHHDVVVTGFRSLEGIFSAYRDELDLHTVRTRAMPAFLSQVRALARSLQADLIYSFKPLSTSLWPGLTARRRLGVPLLVDIEDWEAGWYLEREIADQLKHLAHVERPNGYVWTLLNELLVRLADERLVVNRFLQRRFGGTLLPHGADTTFFDPRRTDRAAALREVGIPDAEYVVFTGAPMPNKGLEDLLSAMRELGRPDTRLLLVGSFEHDPAYRELLLEEFGDLITLIGPRPHSDMPMFLSVASVVALPQRSDRETEAQLPGKVFEAMAMGCPILATAVSDLPEILDGCGVVVPAGRQDALAIELDRLLDDSALRDRLGDEARKRCEERFSWNAMESILEATFDRLVGSGAMTTAAA